MLVEDAIDIIEAKYFLPAAGGRLAAILSQAANLWFVLFLKTALTQISIAYVAMMVDQTAGLCSASRIKATLMFVRRWVPQKAFL